jgi:hypothetical protein
MKTILAFALIALLPSFALAASTVTTELPQDDELAIITTATNKRLVDDNHTSGEAKMFARLLTVDVPADRAALFQLAETNLRDLVMQEHGVVLLPSVKIRFESYDVSTPENRQAVAHGVGAVLAMGNEKNTSKEEEIVPFMNKALTVLNKLPFNENSKMAMTHAVIRDGNNDKRRLVTYTFLNPDTKKLVLFYALEGVL